MRTELDKLEQIDAYLSGKMSSTEAVQFKQAIDADPVLAEQVKEQHQLIQAINRKALSAEIQSVANGFVGGSGGYSTLFWSLSSIAVIGLSIAGFYFFSPSSDEDLVAQRKIQPATTVVSNEPELDLTTRQTILPELPETTFSSKHNYIEDEDDFMNVSVHFQSLGEGEQPTKEGASTKSETSNSDVKERNTEKEKKEVVNKRRQASFPGGHKALKKFIDKNLRYPRTASSKDIEGIVQVDFHIDAQGDISEIEAKCIQMNTHNEEPFSEMKMFMNKKVENLFIGNATHLLRTMPKWDMATDSDGNPILTLQRMYFHYDIEQGCSAYQLDEELIDRNY
jgi:hypothetical protein